MKLHGRDTDRHTEDAEVFTTDLHLVIETTVSSSHVDSDLRCVVERAAHAAAGSYALASTRIVSVETTVAEPLDSRPGADPVVTETLRKAANTHGH
jgi:hypothetical protein